MDINNKKIDESLYDIINKYQSQKFADYYERNYLPPSGCLLLAGSAIVFDNCFRKVGNILDSISREPINKTFTMSYLLLGIGFALLTKNYIQKQKKFVNAKYILKRNGLSASIHSLKKAKTVIYNIQTTKEGLTKEHRAIIINKNKRKQIILREIKNYILEDDFNPVYYLTDFTTLPNESAEKKLILEKSKCKYRK